MATKTTKVSLTYLHYLHLLQSLRDAATIPALEPIEERLVNELAVAWHQGQALTVLDVMDMHVIASRTTIHRRLKALRKQGLIHLESDERDNRVKYVQPTDAMHAYFGALARCMQKAAQ
jgi:hypothetical protein